MVASKKEMKRKIHPRVVLPATAYLCFSSLALSSAVEVTSTEATITGHLRRRRSEEEEVPTDAGDDSGSSSGGDGGIPLSGEFFLMFFYVLLIVFAVLFLPVIWKCAKNAVGVRRKVGLSNGDEEGCCAERTKEDILAGVEDIKQKIAEESRKVRYGATSNSSGKNNDEDTSSSFSSTDAAVQNEETNGGSDHLQMPQTKRNDSTRPMSGMFYGTYYYNNKSRMTPMELTFAPHPRGGYVILGSGQVQSGPTELSEGYLNPNGEAYFVEVGGINPTSVDLDVTKDDLTSRRLAESEVTSLLVLYRGKFDFAQPNVVFKGWRHSSTGISRIYHLLRRPRESKIRHVMSTIGSSIHSVGRRRSSALEEGTGDETKDEELGNDNASGLCGETINQSKQQQNGAFALSSSSEGLT